MFKKIAWSCWAVLPVLAMAFHFGPGQRGVQQDAAAAMLTDARAAESVAADAQHAAHEAQFATIEARRAALLSDAEGNQKAVETALAHEQKLYVVASDAWKMAADKYAAVEQLLEGGKGAEEVRWAKARAMVRAGLIWNGIDELQGILDTTQDESLSVAAREELAAAHYYGARILREEGRASALWQEVAGVARQQYRYLAERAEATGDAPLADNLQKNLERVLDLEQLAQEELIAKPLPKDSPRGRRPGDREPGDGQGRSRRPPQQPGGNGAGGLLEIGPGW